MKIFHPHEVRRCKTNFLERVVYPSVPPHVEYRLTPFGQRFMPILDAIAELQHQLEVESKK
jgi:DNA-binding HxlR family transcriptional regulator